MDARRLAAALAAALLAAAGLIATPAAGAVQKSSPPGGPGPALGKWEFMGKDDTGLAWTGTLSLERVDPARFDPRLYFAVCSLEVESPDQSKGTRGVEAPCAYDPKTREVSFATGFMTVHTYTAVLTKDGKSLADGKWTEVKGEEVVRSGEWTARLPAAR